MSMNDMLVHNAGALAIEAQGLSKSFGRTVALRAIDLTLGWGKALALFGHNGAGKTTLLRVLATLARPDSGTARVAGLDCVRDASRVRSTIGYVGHQTLLYDDLTPRENLEFYARLYRLSDGRNRVEAVLEQTGAVDWADRRVRALSNGMQKRVAIARALLHRPSVLLFDEAETGLDQEGLRLLQDVVEAVTRGGAAAVFTTHSLERGLAMADRVVVLSEGVVALEAEAQSLTVVDVAEATSRQAGIAS